MSRLLNFRQTSSSSKQLQQILQNLSESELAQQCKGLKQHVKPWNVIVWHYLNSILCCIRNRPHSAWQSSVSATEHFRKEVICVANKNNGNVWYLPVLNTVLKNMSDCAVALYTSMENDDDDDDGDHDDTNSKRDIIVRSVNALMLIMREMTADSNVPAAGSAISMGGTTATLNHGLFFTVNQVIKLCDMINNETYLNPALDEVEKLRSVWTSFPLSDVVTHLYYKGRHSVQRGGAHLYHAKRDLMDAHRLCLSSSLNKQRILLLLIPIQMFFGYLPNTTQLDHALQHRFEPLVRALKNGNIFLFRATMDRYQDDFINADIYLLLSKLELLVFRALLQKLYLIKQRMNAAKPNQLDLTEIRMALNILRADHDIDLDEIQCIVSTLIYKRLIAGYVAHNIAVVMSKDSSKAFPSIKQAKDWWINDF